jgi:hypothetical protein
VGHLFKVVLSIALFASGGGSGGCAVRHPPAQRASADSFRASERGGRAAAAEAAGVPSPRLRLVWVDVLGAAPFAYLNASREASAILAGAGVETEWTLGEPSNVTTEDELKVVLLEGIAKGARLPEHVMGGTRRGAQSRTTWIYLSNVLWILGLQDRSPHGFTPAEEEDIARALGRVVAHEIVHAVAPHLPHSRNGLMADRINRVLLIHGSVSLGAREQKALRAGLATFNAPTKLATDAVAMAARSYFSPSTRYSSESDRLKP